MARWGDEKTVGFILHYRNQQCLWNVANPLYKNKFARDRAYRKLMEEMQDGSLTIKCVKNKIKNLRSTFHQEMKKVKDSMRSGVAPSHVYTPSLIWYDDMHSFLGDAETAWESRKTISTKVSIKPDPDDISQSLSEKIVRSEDSQQLLHAELNQESDVHSGELNLQTESTYTRNLPNHRGPHSKKRQRSHSTRSHPNDDPTQHAIYSLDNLSTLIDKPNSIQDEFHYFAQSVAAQLRKLPLENAMRVQADIQYKLSQARIQARSTELGVDSAHITSDSFASSHSSYIVSPNHNLSVEIKQEPHSLLETENNLLTMSDNSEDNNLLVEAWDIS